MAIDHFVAYNAFPENDLYKHGFPIRFVDDQILQSLNKKNERKHNYTKVVIGKMDYFAITATKNGQEKRKIHLAWYPIKETDDKVIGEKKKIKNQLTGEDGHFIYLDGPVGILVPTTKDDDPPDDGDTREKHDHYLVYKAHTTQEVIKYDFKVDDQFLHKRDINLEKKKRPLEFFAVRCSKSKEKPDPDKKPNSTLFNSNDHLAIYKIQEHIFDEFDKKGLKIENQFKNQTIGVGNQVYLFVPTVKSEAD